MNRLLIIGAGGFGREVLMWSRDCNECGVDWEIGGFIDSNPNALRGLDVGFSVIGSVEDYQPQSSDVFVCAIGNPSQRRKCVETMLSKGANFINIIHPTAFVGERVKLGTGIIICPYCVLTCDIEIGNFSALNLRSTIGHDARIGEFCQLSASCNVTGHAKLCDEVFMGSHATVLPKVQIGEGAIVGAGSIVISKVKPRTTVFGAPAKRLS